MFRNYLKVAIRNLLRHKVYSAINVLGLAIGIVCSLGILLYVRYELSYDTHHEKADRIYRAKVDWHYESSTPTGYYGTTSGLLATTLREHYPGVEQVARLHQATAVNWNPIFMKSDRMSGYEDRGYVADASIFDIFTFPLMKGDAKTALEEPFSVVLTEKLAQKYFGDQEPINQVLTMQDTLQFKVTGVLAPIPENSHFTFDYLISFETLNYTQASLMQRWMGWANLGWYTYVLLREGVSPAEMDIQVRGITQQYGAAYEAEHKIWFAHHLQPLADVHLYSSGLLYDIAPPGDIVYVYVFASIALLVLAIACINFMNLATARAVDRAREVGMRKVVGAYRRQLIAQFLGESILVTGVAIVLAVGCGELLLPMFNDFVGRDLALNFFDDPMLLVGLVGIALVVGVLSGSYPAFAISSFRPVEVLKGSLRSGHKGVWIRKGLVVFQFVISIGLMIVTAVVYDQVNHMRSQTLGFDQEQVVVINFRNDPDVQRRYKTIKSELMMLPKVQQVAASATIPGRFFNFQNLSIQMPSGEETMKGIRIQSVDEDYLETLGLTLVSGRAFSGEMETDVRRAFLLNEKAVDYFEWGTPEEALGKAFNARSSRRLVGVLKDFHMVSLHREIEPYLIYYNPRQFALFSVKVRSGDMAATLDSLREKWAELVPGKPFEYFFLDEDFAKQYQAEQHLGVLFSAFAGLAIFVGCLGLFGLISFTAQQRTKEIGIRKVLGASVSQVVMILSKDFVKLVLVANVITWPIAYYAMIQWLQDFAYAIELGMGVFVGGGLIAFLIAVLTVGYQAVKAAIQNPVDALRYE